MIPSHHMPVHSGGNFFATPAYCRAVHELGINREHDFELQNVEIGGRVLRLMVLKTQDSRIIITNAPFLDYHEPLQSWDEIHHRGDWFVPRVALDVVRCDGEAPETNQVLAPFIQLDEFASYDDYCAKKLRPSLFKDHARRRRQAERDLGPLVFLVHDPDATAQAFAWKRDQFPENPEFSEDNLQLFAGMQEHLTVSSLRADGRLLAAWVGFIHLGVWSGWIFAYDPERQLKKYCLGWQLLYSMIGEAFARQCRQFDFSIGSEPYKWSFATHARLCGPIGKQPLLERMVGRVWWFARGVLRRLAQGRRPRAANV